MIVGEKLDVCKTLAFYLPQCQPTEGTFGCATLGFAGKGGAEAEEVYTYEKQPRGIVINGTYEECVSGIPYGNYKAAIVLCGNAGGENVFLTRLQEKLQCPIVGGGAAMDGARGGLITGGGQAAVFLIEDEDYEVQTSVKNIHDRVLGSCKISFDDPRVIRSIDGQDPALWLEKQKAALGIDAADFEHFTLSDKLGVNAHLSAKGQLIVSGRDLEPEMLFRYVRKEDVYQAIYDFYHDEEDAIIFGCAGLKGITGEITRVKSLGLYLFGEICTVQDRAVFGNLMLSKLKLVKKG
ncbi:MAG: hypothetical protein IKV27_00540 [Lachnospiraceae bacterium]|nr:hypothetical protein [Lachnospiraceae bacterium]